MKKLAVIGANEFQQQLILKAREMGLETHVFAWEEGAVGKTDADFFYPISIVERELILQKCMDLQIDGITSIASDLAVTTVNYVSEKMGLPGNSIDSIEVCTNKYRMRQRLESNGIPVPFFKRLSPDQEPDIPADIFPVIVKPTDRSGSRGITRINAWDEEALRQAIAIAADYSFENKAIVEEYLEGEEFSCECISFRGNHTMLAITKKYTTGAPNYIETGHKIPADLTEEDATKIRNVIFCALDALEIRNGASHSEFKYQDGKVRIIEIGARMGGDYIGSDLVYLAMGFDYLKMVIQTALGEAPDLKRTGPERKAHVKFILSEEDLNEWELFKESHDIFRQNVPTDMETRKVVDSSSRWGYYIYCEEC